MTELDVNQLDFVNRYYHLLDTIEEGFNYIDECYDKEREELADPMMADIFTALEKINGANESLRHLFHDDDDVVRAVNRFEGISNVLHELEAHFHNGAKESIICHKLIPSFETWKMNIQQALGRYIIQ